MKARSSAGSRRKSIANSGLNLVQEDYTTSLANLKTKRKEIKNITIETSKNSSIVQNGRPMSWSRKSKVGVFNRKQSSQVKSRRSSNSPLMSARASRGMNSIERLSHRSTKHMIASDATSYNQGDRNYKLQKANLNIMLNGIDSFVPSPQTTRARSRLDEYNNRDNESYKSKRSLKSWKSMKNIGAKRSYSTRSKREEVRYPSSKSYKSAREGNNIYYNYLTSEPLAQLPVFNNLLSKHGHQRSIDTNQASMVIKEPNPFKRSACGSQSSKQVNSRSFKTYENPEAQYASWNFYGNEYTNSAQTSQFTFGPGPDSRISDRGCSGTTSVNKSISKEKMIYNMNEQIKRNKSKLKHK